MHDEVELLDKHAVCVFFGGTNKPIDASTLYRGINDGRFPRPIKVGVQSSRWLRSECEAARDRLINERKPQRHETAA
jgi:predicted DNA-binding transcriptional regulator AlpA